MSSNAESLRSPLRIVARQRAEKALASDTAYIEIGDISTASKAVELKAKSPVLGAQLALPGDVLISTVRPGRGAVAVAPCRAAVSPAFTVLYGANPVDTRLIFHVTCQRSFAQHLERLATGSTYPTCSDRDVLSFETLVPPSGERERIVVVLDTLDEATRKTAQTIEKLRQMRQGLLHDLLARGIDENGMIRDPKRQADGFRRSALGVIPKRWEETTVGSLLQSGDLQEVQDGNHGELHPKRDDFTTEGVPFVMAKDLSGGRIDFKGSYRISWRVYSSLRVGFSRGGDVLLSHKGTVGETALVPSQVEHLMLTPQVTYYRVGPSQKVTPEFLLWWMRGWLFQRRLENLAGQSTRDYVALSQQRELPIVLPPLGEQRSIATMLAAAASRIETELAVRDKLQVIKHGLATDLLSGSVRARIPAGYPV